MLIANSLLDSPLATWRTITETRIFADDTILDVETDVPGLSAEDMAASVATLRSLAETLNAECVLLREHPEKGGSIAEYLVRNRAEEDDFMEVRCGEADLFISRWVCRRVRGVYRAGGGGGVNMAGCRPSGVRVRLLYIFK